jgi:catechol 2,3-dioxygenase-like lactoylglutathione lyase family enzyme
MIDHVSLQVTDVPASRAFYAAVLAPLGLGPIDVDPAVGFGDGDHFCFWLSPAERTEDRELHLAFGAADRAQVRAFHDAALAIGAEVLHQPRVFPEYGPDYYGCFIRDPDGHNLEAVCRLPAA